MKKGDFLTFGLIKGLTVSKRKTWNLTYEIDSEEGLHRSTASQERPRLGAPHLGRLLHALPLAEPHVPGALKER